MKGDATRVLRRSLIVFACLIAAYAVILGLAYFGPERVQDVASLAVLIPYFSTYLFHNAGIPGLLEHNGLCGWGWCSPTPAGWALLVVFWTGLFWVASWGIAWLWERWHE